MRQQLTIFSRQLLCWYSIIFALFVTTANAEHKFNNQLVKTRQGIQQLHHHLVTNKTKVKQLLYELQQVDEQINQVSQKIYKLTTNLQHEQQVLRQLQTKLVKITSQYHNQQKILAEQLQLGQKFAQVPTLKIFLNHADPNTIARLLTYYRYLTKQQQQRIKDSIKMLANVQRLKTKLQTKITTINTTKTKTTAKMHTLERAKAKRAKLLASLQQAMTIDNQALASLKRDEQLLESKIANLQQKTAAQSVKSGKINIANKAIFDNLLPHQPIINTSAKLKMRAISAANSNRFLIQAHPGSKVHAVHHGRVIFADWLRGYGLLLIVAHNNDLMSLYGNNQTVFKKVGDKVGRGEVIALVGQSGGQLLPGLYFEIRKAAKSINLRNWFNYETI